MSTRGFRRSFNSTPCPIEGCEHAMGLHGDRGCSICSTSVPTGACAETNERDWTERLTAAPSKESGK
jgi:hypothetical protein